MSAKTNYRNANRFGCHGRLAAVVAVVILSSQFWGGAQAADKGGAKAMISMEMHKSMMKGMKDMQSMQATGDIDHDFAMMMRMHHQNALDMASVELQQGKDPVLRSMAKEIIASQKKEIKEFDRWLAKHKQPMAEPMSKSK